MKKVKESDVLREQDGNFDEMINRKLIFFFQLNENKDSEDYVSTLELLLFLFNQDY